MKSFLFRTTLYLALLVTAAPAFAEVDGKLQILLLGDSTTIGSVCRAADPSGLNLEDVVRLVLAAEKDLPPTNVINIGRDGETIEGLLARYDRDVAKMKGLDYVFIRYGLNDNARRKDFVENFPKDFHELIQKLRKDFPQAVVIPTTIIPYITPETDEKINQLIRKAAEVDKAPLFDVYTRYQAELAKGQNMLNYRRYPLAKIPEPLQGLAKPYVRGTSVVVMDNRLDAHFGDLPGWFGDRHPSPAGYHVIGDETAKFLAKMIREKRKNAGTSAK